MSDKKRRTIVIILMALIGFAIVFNGFELSRLAADSGFDVDYDSDWGDSDWGSSWHDHDYNNHNYNNSDRHSSSDLGLSPEVRTTVNVFIIIFIIVIITITALYLRKLFKTDWSEQDEEMMDIKENNKTLEELLKNNPKFNKEDFYQFVYDSFVNIQNAWMNFDYDGLRDLLTDELYNTYKSQLKTLSLKNQTNIMNSFEKMDSAIVGYNKSENKETIRVLLRVKFIDYIQGSDGKVVRGNDEVRVIVTYKLTYVKSLGKKDNKCPNCGAKLNRKASKVCPYCKSTIVSNSHEYVLAKKENIEQTMEE